MALMLTDDLVEIGTHVKPFQFRCLTTLHVKSPEVESSNKNTGCRRVAKWNPQSESDRRLRGLGGHAPRSSGEGVGIPGVNRTLASGLRRPTAEESIGGDILVRLEGVEHSSPTWQAGAVPLSHNRILGTS